MQFVLKLVADARANGISEIQYKELRLKLSARAQESGNGPVEQRGLPGSPKWSTSIPLPE